MRELHCEFEIFPAVDGIRSSHPLFARYDDRLRLRSRRRPLSGGELGCWASHYLLWEKCIESNKPLIVMEDDVIVEDFFVAALNTVSAHINTFKYLRLAGTSLDRRPYQIVGSLGKFDLVDHIRGPAGTLCYAIHPYAAKSLIEHAENWYQAVDDYMDRYWIHGVDCLSLMPFSVKVSNLESDIQRQSKGKMSALQKIRQELFRRYDQLRRLVYRFSRKDITL